MPPYAFIAGTGTTSPVLLVLSFETMIIWTWTLTRYWTGKGVVSAVFPCVRVNGRCTCTNGELPSAKRISQAQNRRFYVASCFVSVSMCTVAFLKVINAELSESDLRIHKRTEVFMQYIHTTTGQVERLFRLKRIVPIQSMKSYKGNIVRSNSLMTKAVDGR